MLYLAVITVPSLSWHENICCLPAISTSPISLENFMDRDDLLFSITSHASQCTQLFLLRSPVSPSTSFFFFLSASPMRSEFQLICLSNQYLTCHLLCVATAVNTAPLRLTAQAVFSSEHDSSSSSRLKPLFFSFNILKLIFSAFLFRLCRALRV